MSRPHHLKARWVFTNSSLFVVDRARLRECGISSWAGSSVVQLAWLNEISDSNINSSASLMRTMRANYLSKERHYGSLCEGEGQPCLQRLPGRESLKQYTTPASTLLCYTRLSYPWGGLSALLLYLWFCGTKSRRQKSVPKTIVQYFKRMHPCEWFIRSAHRGLID